MFVGTILKQLRLCLFTILKLRYCSSHELLFLVFLKRKAAISFPDLFYSMKYAATFADYNWLV
jgi:hypothetical protein